MDAEGELGKIISELSLFDMSADEHGLSWAFDGKHNAKRMQNVIRAMTRGMVLASRTPVTNGLAEVVLVESGLDSNCVKKMLNQKK